MDVRESVRQAAGSARDALQRGRESARYARERFSDAMEGLGDAGRRTLERAQQSIQEQPVLWTLSALGVGVLLGAIFTMRRRD